VDGIKRYVTYSQYQEAFILANIPFFWYNVTLDPNFGFLVGSQSGDDVCKENVGIHWEIYLSIPIGVLFILFIAFLANYARMRGWFKSRQKPACSVEMDMDSDAENDLKMGRMK
jgi:hypothetical protein